MRKIKIVIVLMIFSLNFFLVSIVYSEGNVENPDSIKQEFIKLSPELIAFENCLSEAEQFYQDLKDKYIWVKRNKIKPSEEAKKLLSPGFEIYDDQSMDKAFSKLPWGGWSREWSKKVDNLMKRMESIETSQKDSYKLKAEIKGILSSMIILRSEYETALDGNETNVDYFVDYISEGLDRCKKILSIFSSFGGGEKTTSYPLNEEKAEFSNKELVCDLGKGLLGDLRIGDFAKPKNIVKTMGGQPEEKENEIFGINYKYFDKGVIVLLTGTSKISMIYVYYSNLEEFDGTYKKFNGKIVPLNDHENIRTIKGKFGTPNEENKDIIYGTPEFIYKRPYGELHFCFDKSGNLDLVTMVAD